MIRSRETTEKLPQTKLWELEQSHSLFKVFKLGALVKTGGPGNYGDKANKMKKENSDPRYSNRSVTSRTREITVLFCLH